MEDLFQAARECGASIEQWATNPPKGRARVHVDLSERRIVAHGSNSFVPSLLTGQSGAWKVEWMASRHRLRCSNCKKEGLSWEYAGLVCGVCQNGAMVPE
jgi:hypothetical protein